MNLIGKKIYLRALKLEDMKTLNEMINDSETEKMVVGWSKPVTENEQNQWYLNLKNDNNIRYAITSISEKESAIGTATIRNIDWKNRNASLDIKLLKEVRSKGYGTDTIKTLLKYCFEELNLNRISANILEYNEASKKIFEKCNFKLEGIQKEIIYKNGEYNSLMNYAILKKEYLLNNEGNW